MQPSDYISLAEQAGFVKIACLKPPRLADGYLSSHLDNWLKSNAGALSYIDSKRDILVAPFAQRPWAKSLIIASFLPERDNSPLLQLPCAHDGRPFAEIAPTHWIEITTKRVVKSSNGLKNCCSSNSALLKRSLESIVNPFWKSHLRKLQALDPAH